jgi:hypothetical protein
MVSLTGMWILYNSEAYVLCDLKLIFIQIYDLMNDNDQLNLSLQKFEIISHIEKSTGD